MSIELESVTIKECPWCETRHVLHEGEFTAKFGYRKHSGVNYIINYTCNHKKWGGVGAVELLYNLPLEAGIEYSKKLLEDNNAR